MYDVAKMKADLISAVAATEARIQAEFVSAFNVIYSSDEVPSTFAGTLPRVDRISVSSSNDLEAIESKEGFYIILSDRPVVGNTCKLTAGQLRAIYRGECSTTRKRIQSHLFNSLYNSDFDRRSSNYRNDPKNAGKSFYEAHWPHCLKLDEGGPSGINVDQAPYSEFKWLVIVHDMQGSSQRVRQLAEKAFDAAFNHPEASRDTYKSVERNRPQNVLTGSLRGFAAAAAPHVEQ